MGLANSTKLKSMNQVWKQRKLLSSCTLLYLVILLKVLLVYISCNVTLVFACSVLIRCSTVHVIAQPSENDSIQGAKCKNLLMQQSLHVNHQLIISLLQIHSLASEQRVIRKKKKTNKHMYFKPRQGLDNQNFRSIDNKNSLFQPTQYIQENIHGKLKNHPKQFT